MRDIYFVCTLKLSHLVETFFVDSLHGFGAEALGVGEDISHCVSVGILFLEWESHIICLDILFYKTPICVRLPFPKIQTAI